MSCGFFFIKYLIRGGNFFHTSVIRNFVLLCVGNAPPHTYSIRKNRIKTKTWTRTQSAIVMIKSQSFSTTMLVTVFSHDISILEQKSL